VTWQVRYVKIFFGKTSAGRPNCIALAKSAACLLSILLYCLGIFHLSHLNNLPNSAAPIPRAGQNIGLYHFPWRHGESAFVERHCQTERSVVFSVASSWPASTATFAKNHGHFMTSHRHHKKISVAQDSKHNIRKTLWLWRDYDISLILDSIFWCKVRQIF